MSKNLVLGSIFTTFGPNSDHHFFSKIWQRQSLDIIVSYPHGWRDGRMDGGTDEQVD